MRAARTGRGRAPLILLLAAALGGCELEPDVGPPQQARCLGADSDPDVEVSFRRDVMPIFAREDNGCGSCHIPGMGDAIGITIGGLDLSSHAATLRGGARSGPNAVVPGDPCASFLYLKLLPGPPVGGRMPLDGPPYLSTREQLLIHDWIAEGARDN